MKAHRGKPAPVLVALSCPVVVALCVVFVDRPAAILSHAGLVGERPVFDALTRVVDPVPPAAGVGIAGAGLAALFGWRPGPLGRALVACCLSALIATALNDQLKYAFGRLWPETRVEANPSLIHDGAYGFFPLHGGRGWASFPSGHTTLITAPVAVLWSRLPRWRPILAASVALVMVGLLGADYHLVGDMAAGLYLGAACGTGALALLRGSAGPAAAPPP